MAAEGPGDEWLLALRLAQELRAEGLEIADLAVPGLPLGEAGGAPEHPLGGDRVAEVVEQWWVPGKGSVTLPMWIPRPKRLFS